MRVSALNCLLILVSSLLFVTFWFCTYQGQLDAPIIYAITPTYKRITQKADLTQMVNTLRQVPRLHWIVVEDSENKTKLVTNFLRNSGMLYTHLNIPTPSWCLPNCVARGTEQRNIALDWLREHRRFLDSGVVFFADDDNTYSLDLFEEMRYTEWVSVWPVGFTGRRLHQSPIVENNKVVGWYSGWVAGRQFPVDMAGFGVNLQVILTNPNARFQLEGALPGRQETDFLSRITRMEDLEPKADSCTRVLVWHTRTEKPAVENIGMPDVEV